jgi:predicted dehydrogenase
MSTHAPVGIAIIGCGFVADLYLETLRRHRMLHLCGVFDCVQERSTAFARQHSVEVYPNLEKLLADPRVELVLNLTNPHAHYTVSRACLEAGKHVYSEKPLALQVDHARELVALAEMRGLLLSGAPSRLLGRPAQTMWKALRDGRIGQPYLAYAEMDDGLLHRMTYRRWIGASGAPWPYVDELEVGNTLEHAGYALTWLVAMLGPVRRVTAFASRQVHQKNMDVPLEKQAADFSVAALQHENGAVSRLTCSIIAPHDHRLMIAGEEGTLWVDDCWKPTSAVRRRGRIEVLGRSREAPFSQRLKLLGDAEAVAASKGRRKVDFCLGPVDLALAMREARAPRLSAQFCLHITEIALAISNALDGPAVVDIASRFETPAPMPWAADGTEPAR